MTAHPRRLRWQIFDEGRVGVIITDLDTEQWATGSAATEQTARAIALRNLDEHPSGGAVTARSDRARTLSLGAAFDVLDDHRWRHGAQHAEALDVVLDALTAARTHAPNLEDRPR